MVQSERFQPAGHREPELPAIHVIDDEASVRTALARLLGADGCYRVSTHACADDFLAAFEPDAHSCVILDVGLPGLNGVELQEQLLQGGQAVPIVFLSGCADVPMCAEALRRGAVDFLTKPV